MKLRKSKPENWNLPKMELNLEFKTDFAKTKPENWNLPKMELNLEFKTDFAKTKFGN